MSDVLDRVRAQMEHFKATVCPDAWIGRNQVTGWLCLELNGAPFLKVTVGWNEREVLTTSVLMGRFPQDMPPVDIARAGGMLIQLSNLMTQIQALAPEVPSVSEEQPAAVG